MTKTLAGSEHVPACSCFDIGDHRDGGAPCGRERPSCDPTEAAADVELGVRSQGQFPQVTGIRSPVSLLTEVETLSFATAERCTGLSRSTLYRLIWSGDIEAIKIGRRTLIVARTLANHLRRAPTVVLRRSGP
jgi:excisionase family DNA binding protein